MPVVSPLTFQRGRYTVTINPSAAPMRARLRSQRDLRQAMMFNRLNVRELSELCGSLRHRSTIGHLHSGTRATCDVFLARRIEDTLRMPPGSLFMPLGCSDNRVATTTNRKKVAA